jgi:hypothetical protein
MKKLLSHTLGIFMFTELSAQPDHTYVRECDITFRTHIVRCINLRHAANEEIFGKGRIVETLLAAAFANEIPVYNPENKTQILSNEALLERLTVKADDGTSEIYSYKQLYQIEVGEDLVFDKQRSIPVYQVKYLTLFIPQDINYRDLHEPVATFRFQDCEKFFRGDICGANSFSYNSEINFRDAILLHMYKSEIVKMGREEDLYFDQKYPDPAKAFLARKKSEEDVLEYFYKIYNPE